MHQNILLCQARLVAEIDLVDLLDPWVTEMEMPLQCTLQLYIHSQAARE